VLHSPPLRLSQLHTEQVNNERMTHDNSRVDDDDGNGGSKEEDSGGRGDDEGNSQELSLSRFRCIVVIHEAKIRCNLFTMVTMKMATATATTLTLLKQVAVYCCVVIVIITISLAWARMHQQWQCSGVGKAALA